MGSRSHDASIAARTRSSFVASAIRTWSDARGYVTFAQSSALNSRTTQLFVNLGNNARLDTMRFAPFAVVISGMDAVESLNAEYAEAP